MTNQANGHIDTAYYVCSIDMIFNTRNQSDSILHSIAISITMLGEKGTQLGQKKSLNI